MNSNIDEAVNYNISLYRRSAKYMHVFTSKVNNQPIRWDLINVQSFNMTNTSFYEFRKSNGDNDSK